MGIFTEKKVTLSEAERASREATDRERGVWQEVIFRCAKRCNVDIRGLSPGQVVSEMANRVLFSRVEARYCCLCDRRRVDQPITGIPGVDPEHTLWVCSAHAKALKETSALGYGDLFDVV